MKSILCGVVFRGVAACMILASCTTAPRTLKWYEARKGVERQWEWTQRSCHENRPWIFVSAFSLPPTPESRFAVWDLADDAQAAIIEALAQQTTTKDELLAAVAKALPGRAESDSLDLTTVRRRIVLSAENLSTEPADRIMRLAYLLELEDSQATFRSWDKIVTEHETIDLGKLTFARSGTIGISSSPLEVGGEAGLTEEKLLRKRLASTSGNLGVDYARIVRQGAPGIDVDGSVVFEIELKLLELQKVWVVAEFTASQGTGAVPPRFRVVEVRIPKIAFSGADPLALRGTVLGEYWFRRVLSGRTTIDEGDDIITIIEDSVPCDPLEFTLLPVEEMQYSTWAVADQTSGKLLTTDRAPGGLENSEVAAELFILTFASSELAYRFLDWFRRNQVHDTEESLSDSLLGRSSLAGWPLFLCDWSKGSADCGDASIDPHRLGKLKIHRIDWNTDLDRLRRIFPGDYR